MRKDKGVPKSIPKELPQWLGELPKHSLITYKEFACALGITPDGLARRIRRGEVPERCVFIFKKCSKNSIDRTPKHYWKACVVRNYMRKLIRESKNER